MEEQKTLGSEDQKKESSIPKWYIVHTRTGYENRVKENLEQRLENESEAIRKKILEIRILTKQVVENRNGKKKIVEKKVFPSYVHIKMVMTPETWYLVRNTSGVTGFCGMGNTPVPLTEAEAAFLEGNSEETHKIEVNYKEGDTVQIVSGAWSGNDGIVSKITDHAVVVLVEAFGGKTPVHLQLDEVAKK